MARPNAAWATVWSMSTAARLSRVSGPTVSKSPPTNSTFESVGESARARTGWFRFGFQELSPPVVVSISASRLRVVEPVVGENEVKSPPTYSQRCTPLCSASARTVLFGFGWKDEATERSGRMWARFLMAWPPTFVKLPPM